MKQLEFLFCCTVVIIGLWAGPVYSLELLEPVQVEYSTYLGGTNLEYGNAITVDSNGSAYVTGRTDSTDFPTDNPYQGNRSNAAFITKFGGGGSSLIFSTYLSGSSGTTYGYGIAIDSELNVYVTGETSAPNFPTVNPYQSTHAGGNENIFVSKVSSTGSELLYSTYLGGSSNHDEPYQIVVDSNNSAYVTGHTTSTDFPVVNAYQSSYAGGGSPEIQGDAFVTKFASSGSDLIYSTYVGGSDGDGYRDMALGTDNTIYLAGRSSSDDFPTVNPYQSSRAWNIDAIVSKLSSSGSSLVYSTYLGGDHHDTGRGIAVNSTGYAYVTGDTFSDDFPTVNPYQAGRVGNTYDAFVTRFNPDGTSLSFSTYLGGAGTDAGDGIALSWGIFPYITGDTSSTDFPMANAYQSTYGGDNSDAFVCKLSCQGVPLYSTYLGGSNTDEGVRIAVDFQGLAYVIGTTQSTNFPMENAYQTTPDESWGNAFVTKLFQPSLSPVYESGDYNGDGTSDIAIFRPGSGLWAIRDISRIYFGGSTDQVIPGDYNGDGTADVGIFRKSAGLWAIRGVTRAYYGTSTDQPVPSDYDGDGTCDIGIFRDASGLWSIQGITRVYFGTENDTPVPGDYNGNGVASIGIFRPQIGLWALNGVTRLYFGRGNDQVATGDYDGNGTWEIALFRPGAGLWAINGLTRIYYGTCEDQALQADYDGNGIDDPGIFRSRRGLWATRGITRAYFGGINDIAVTR